jgi:hypothetical protein
MSQGNLRSLFVDQEVENLVTLSFTASYVACIGAGKLSSPVGCVVVAADGVSVEYVDGFT